MYATIKYVADNHPEQFSPFSIYACPRARVASMPTYKLLYDDASNTPQRSSPFSPRAYTVQQQKHLLSLCTSLHTHIHTSRPLSSLFSVVMQLPPPQPGTHSLPSPGLRGAERRSDRGVCLGRTDGRTDLRTGESLSLVRVCVRGAF